MSVRLNKIARDLNVGIITAVEFLQKKGFTVEANPNTKITDEQYDLLLKEFSTDKDIKQRSDKFIRDRHTKDRNKTSVAIEGYENPKEEEDKKFISAKDSIENFIPKFKPVGKIELDKLNGKIHSVAPQAEPFQTEEAPKTEEAMPETKPESTTETLAEIKSETHKDSESQANAGEASQSVVKEPEITEEPVVAGKEPEPECGCRIILLRQSSEAGCGLLPPQDHRHAVQYAVPHLFRYFLHSDEPARHEEPGYRVYHQRNPHPYR